MSGALFDVPGIKHAPPPEPGLSPTQRRTRRQLELLLAGYHPLTLVLSSPLKLHPDAAPADDTKAPGVRCGSCRFRELLGHHNRSYPKCVRPGMPVTHGPGTDCRAWWPACPDFEPAEST